MSFLDEGSSGVGFGNPLEVSFEPEENVQETQINEFMKAVGQMKSEESEPALPEIKKEKLMISKPSRDERKIGVGNPK